MGHQPMILDAMMDENEMILAGVAGGVGADWFSRSCG